MRIFVKPQRPLIRHSQVCVSKILTCNDIAKCIKSFPLSQLDRFFYTSLRDCIVSRGKTTRSYNRQLNNVNLLSTRLSATSKSPKSLLSRLIETHCEINYRNIWHKTNHNQLSLDKISNPDNQCLSDYHYVLPCIQIIMPNLILECRNPINLWTQK